MIEVGKIRQIWAETFAWSKKKAFKGHNKHDGLNSKILRFFLGWSKWSRIIAVQIVTRFPVNIRTLLLVPNTYNPKGLALFCSAAIRRYQQTGGQQYLTEALELIVLLEQLKVKTNSGYAWGYHYPWQDPGFYAPAEQPNAVVSSFVCQAYLDVFETTSDHALLETIETTLQFFMHDLTVLKSTDDELCLSYMPLDMTMRVMDVSILIGQAITRFNYLSGKSEYQDEADKLVRYVVRQQTPEGAWFYTDPPSDSHITHDNYHTGFILDALYCYMKLRPSINYDEEYERGLEFYAQKLFTSNGEPKWMFDTLYPMDIHGSAQGIITFSRHRDKYPDLADSVMNWTLTNMYNGAGGFYYQKCRLYTKKFILLRWCNGWMCRAMSEYLKYRN